MFNSGLIDNLLLYNDNNNYQSQNKKLMGCVMWCFQIDEMTVTNLQ